MMCAWPGDVIMKHLLLDTSMFKSLPNGCLMQVRHAHLPSRVCDGANGRLRGVSGRVLRG